MLRIPAFINVLLLALALLLAWRAVHDKKPVLALVAAFIFGLSSGFSLAVLIAGGTFERLVS